MNLTDKRRIYRYILFLFTLTLITILPVGCTDSEATISPVERISNTCENTNYEFPEELIEVEFREYSIPDESDPHIIHEIRIKNITDEILKMNISGYYNQELDMYIIAREGYLQPETDKVVDIAPDTGWVILNTFTLLKDWDSFSEENKAIILELSEKLYFDIQIDGIEYCAILDFAEKKVIS